MPKNVDARDSGHVCHGMCVKKYEVQSVIAHESRLWQQNVVCVSPAMVTFLAFKSNVHLLW